MRSSTSRKHATLARYSRISARTLCLALVLISPVGTAQTVTYSLGDRIPLLNESFYDGALDPEVDHRWAAFSYVNNEGTKAVFTGILLLARASTTGSLGLAGLAFFSLKQLPAPEVKLLICSKLMA